MFGRLIWLGLRLLIYGWMLAALLHDGGAGAAPKVGRRRRRSRALMPLAGRTPMPLPG
jgi:hypothetical protein